jgi:hypothetical protein
MQDISKVDECRSLRDAVRQLCRMPIPVVIPFIELGVHPVSLQGLDDDDQNQEQRAYETE